MSQRSPAQLKKNGAQIVAITTQAESLINEIADILVLIDAAAKQDNSHLDASAPKRVPSTLLIFQFVEKCC